jgi:hypothetical protein
LTVDDVITRLARELIESYPEETAGLSVAEVAHAWGEHSEDCYGAGWITPDPKDVAEVMNEWRTVHPLGSEIAALRAEVARLETVVVDLRGELTHDGPVTDILFRADRPCNPASDGRLARRSLPSGDFGRLVAEANEIRGKRGE